MQVRVGTSGCGVRRAAAAMLALVMLSLWTVAETALAQGPAPPPDMTTRAKQAILVDANTGAVLFQHNADELAPPASMSKLMTLAVIFRALKDGRLKPEDEILFSVNAWRTGGAPSGTSAMFVPVNTKEPLSEVLKGIIIQSGNDACIAVAEAMAGSEAAFAKMMTDEARKLGLTKSTFRNATGLYDPEHLMTARELALIARHLIQDYPEHYALFAEREDRIQELAREQREDARLVDQPLVAAAVEEQRPALPVARELDLPEEQRMVAAPVRAHHARDEVRERPLDERRLVHDLERRVRQVVRDAAGEAVGEAALPRLEDADPEADALVQERAELRPAVDRDEDERRL